MDQKNTSGHGFGNGFILGLLVGIIATLLLTTKKGREILHELTEKGLDRFSDLEARLQETATKAKSEMKKTTREYDDLEEEEGDDYLPEEPLPVKLAEEISETKETHHEKEHHQEHSHAHHHHEEHEEGHKSNGSRRFFKKRAN